MTRSYRPAFVTTVLLTVSAITLAPVAYAQPGRSTASQEKAADSLYAAKAYGRAYVLYDSLAHRDTTSGKYWYQLGFAAANLGRYAEGAAAFERATPLTRNPGAAYNAGAMHARLAHADSAITWLTKAVAMGFSDGNLLQQDDDLASVRGDARFAKIVYDATHAPSPCDTTSDNRRFDFWIGEWNVTTQGGSPTGQSSIQRVSGGCALLENWTSLRGSVGKSLSAYNPNSHQWQQYYVGQGGGVGEFDLGEWDGSSIVFRTAPTAGPNGAKTIGRLSFTPLSDGTVRQHGEQSTDGGTSWSTTYDFYYHRKAP